MSRQRYLRFSLSDRLEHIAQIVAFTALAVTGIPQRYPGAGISRTLIDWMGGIESVRIIHRIFATVLMVAVVYHLGAIAYRKYVQNRPAEMLPTKADAAAAAHSMRYLIGREAGPAPQGRFTWEEKIEYFALVWGTLVMIVSGFLLWNPVATTALFPGEFVPAAKVFHSGEALLAVLAVIVWHFYHVHIRSFNTSMFTGYLSRRDMEHEHALELARIERGEAFTAPRDEAARRRARIFFPAFGAVAAVLGVGIFLFVSFEDTAIATVTPPEQVAVFAPVETSGTTQAATTTEPGGTPTTEGTTTTTLAPVAWEDTISLVFREQSCTDCHGRAMALGGLNLADYQSTLGVIVPGDPAASPLITLMEGRAHPTVLDDDQLELVRAWIAAGALETLGSAPPEGGPSAAPGWDTPVAGLLSSCTSCHGGASPLGGLDLSNFEGTLASVTPGDPDGPPLYSVQAAGGHAGQLDDAALVVIREWILAGAPEVGGEASGEAPPQASAPTWDAEIMAMLSSCTGCHGSAGGVDLSTYESALEALSPGAPDDSPLYTVQTAGGHPGQLSEADLEILRLWIEAGAP